MDVLLSLLSIITIDLVLAGDNAIVIGMAARNLPAEQQKRAILWGTAGAIVIRALTTIAVVWLLGMAGLKLAGGVLLMWIAYRLLVEKEEGSGHVNAGMSQWKAIATIIVADTVMGLDNVLAVAGAAHGDILLVVVGLLISIPIMVFCSTMVIRLMVQFPWLIYLGSGVLAWTAARMVTEEGFVHAALAGLPLIRWLLTACIVAGPLTAGWLVNRRRQRLLQAGMASTGDEAEGNSTASA